VSTVIYPFGFAYRYIERGFFPALQITVESRERIPQSVVVDAFLDSGAEASLFQGFIAQVIGLNLFNGTQRRYASTSGIAIEARKHPVRLSHPGLGSFDLSIGFSTGEISRNLLGRDFFNLIQIGFRENQQTFFILSTA
jgi:hypothetical protein